MDNPLDPSDPLAPGDPLDPLAPPDPLRDMLDGLERSIEPPALEDPLADQSEAGQDDLGRVLDAVEGSIDHQPPVQPVLDVGEDVTDANVDQPDVNGFEPDALDEDHVSGTSAASPFGSFESMPPLLPDSSAGPGRPQLQPPLPPRSRGGGGGSKGPGLLQRLLSLRRRSVKSSYAQSLRQCPASGQIIDTQQCESCERFRRWPEGSDGEPRECWHDWQAKRFEGLADPGGKDESTQDS